MVVSPDAKAEADFGVIDIHADIFREEEDDSKDE
jgi:hypothetical protein